MVTLETEMEVRAQLLDIVWLVQRCRHGLPGDGDGDLSAAVGPCVGSAAVSSWSPWTGDCAVSFGLWNVQLYGLSARDWEVSV